MPKLKNVTEAEITAAVDLTNDFHETIADITNRLRGGYVDELQSPNILARNLTSIAVAAADLANAILVRAAMDEQKREYQRLLELANGPAA